MIINLKKLVDKEIVDTNPKFEKLFLNHNQLSGDVVVIVHNKNNITALVPGYIDGDFIIIKDSDVTEKLLIRDNFHDVKGIKFTGATLNFRRDRLKTGRKYGLCTDWFIRKE